MAAADAQAVGLLFSCEEACTNQFVKRLYVGVVGVAVAFGILAGVNATMFAVTALMARVQNVALKFTLRPLWRSFVR